MKLPKTATGSTRQSVKMRNRFSIFTVITAVLFFGVLIALTGSGPVGYLRGLVVRLASPIANIARQTGQWFGFGLVGLSQERVRLLEQESGKLETATARLVELEIENRSLQRALGVRAEFGPRLRNARILSYRQTMGRETLVIDLGRDVGVQRGDIVIDENRLLVGEISEAGIGFSKVAIASNLGMAFSAALEPLGGKVLAKGLGARALALEFVPADAPVRSGDFVIWSQENEGILPAVFAARVVAPGMVASGWAFKAGRATLLADPERLTLVMVLVKR